MDGPKHGSSPMRFMTDDLRIREIKELAPPAHLIREFPCGDVASQAVHAGRAAAHRILHGMDDRLLVIMGPCSIHDPKAALEYAGRLAAERRRLAADLEIIMRVYFEKPRTTESQVHRELASGLSCPVGFKNGTDGNVRIAAEAIRAAHRRSYPPGATRIATSSCAAARRPTSMPPAWRPPARSWRATAWRSG